MLNQNDPYNDPIPEIPTYLKDDTINTYKYFYNMITKNL